MTFENLSLLNISVLLMVALIVLQTVLLVITAFSLHRQVRHLDRILERLSVKSDDGLRLVHHLLESLEQLTPRLTKIAEEVEVKVRRGVDTVHTADEELGRKVDLLRYHVQQYGGQLDQQLNEVSQLVYKIQRVMLYPSLRLANLVQAGMTVLKRAASRQGSTSSAPQQGDGETFI